MVVLLVESPAVLTEVERKTLTFHCGLLCTFSDLNCARILLFLVYLSKPKCELLFRFSVVLLEACVSL